MSRYNRVKDAIKFTNPGCIPLQAPEDTDPEIDSIFACILPVKDTTGGTSIESESKISNRIIILAKYLKIEHEFISWQVY